jgi:hypothetical protein
MRLRCQIGVSDTGTSSLACCAIRAGGARVTFRSCIAGSFVSGIAVLASLVYLSLQMRQNRKHTAAQISQARMEFGALQQERYVTDPVLTQIMMRAASGDLGLNDIDQVRFGFMLRSMFMMIEDEFRQHQAGLISDAQHKGFIRRFSRPFRLPGYRAAWVIERDGFEPDFQAYMDPIVQRERESGLSMPVGNWKAALEAELAIQATARPETSPPRDDADR